MEQRFGHNFSRVRVHSGAVAEQSARDVNANAYTVGHNIVFGASRFKPGTHEGRRLIAHELTHVLQQSSPGRRASHIQREAASKAEQGTSNQYLDAVLAFLKTPDVEPDYVSALAVLNGISMKGILDILSELKLRGLLNTLLDHYADNQKIFVIRIYVAIHAVLESGKTTRDDFRAKFYYELKELPEDQQSLILDKFPKEQTKKLISQSKALNDAKLRLGLGPVTDKALSDSVSVKGEENPDPNTANQEVEFSGPSVGLTPEDQLIVGRIIHYSDPEGMGFISKYERGTEAQLEQRQQDADMAGNAQESQRFQMVGAGIVGGLAQARATSEANQQATSQSGQPTYEPKIGANKPAPPRYGGLVPPKPGEISTMGGFQDEMEVARLTGGRLARESKVNAGGVVKDLKVRFTRPNGQQGAVEVDVVGPNNELILVGGPAKAGNLSETIERLKSLKIAADQKGVKGVAYFTSDTPTDLLNRAGNILGSDNVRPFQRPTYKVPTQR
jgi:hypothetical protein